MSLTGGGQFMLSFNGDQTSWINGSAACGANVGAALEALDSIGSLNVGCTAGSPTIWSITFDTNAGNLPQLLASANGTGFYTTVDGAGVGNKLSSASDSVVTATTTEGTSSTMGGLFTAEVLGERTGCVYCPTV